MPSVPLPRRSAVPPYGAAERGTLGRNPGTEHRNGNGTVELDALADRVSARVTAERLCGTRPDLPRKASSPTPSRGVAPIAVGMGRNIRSEAAAPLIGPSARLGAPGLAASGLVPDGPEVDRRVGLGPARGDAGPRLCGSAWL